MNNVATKLVGTIVDVSTEDGLDTYKLNSGYMFIDEEGSFSYGDKVLVKPLILDIVEVEPFGN